MTKGHSDIEKLRYLLPHWIEHNTEHSVEFQKWAAKAEVAEPDIMEAAEKMEAANQALQTALKKLGGPLAGHQHAHHE